MDQNGAAAPPRPAKPPAEPPGVHRPSGRPPPAPAVTLQNPRPLGDRRPNNYVETPPRNCRPRQERDPRSDKEGRSPVTTRQPSKRAAPQPCPEAQYSIRCARCRRCQCAQCARPRPLPSRWFGDSCLCSAETAIDYVSCMCCAKALFYHCRGDGGDGGASCADEPCSCGGGRWGARWGCLAALTVALPCLWCYWPLRGAAALCAGAYARTGPSGCRCGDRAPDKLPLAPGPPPDPDY